MKTVIIIEDNTIVAEILRRQINSSGDYLCENYFTNPLEFLRSDENPDIVILDIMMPEMNGVDAIDKILKKCPQASVVMNSEIDDSDTIYQIMQKGAVGFIDKQSFNKDIFKVLKSIENGGAYLTPKVAKKVMEFFSSPKKVLEPLSEREHEIANTILDGLSYKMIAEKMFISLDTVRSHIKNIYKKLNINSKTELFNVFKT
jgi:DNA-binding NarL/FixJ family response regulator